MAGTAGAVGSGERKGGARNDGSYISDIDHLWQVSSRDWSVTEDTRSTGRRTTGGGSTASAGSRSGAGGEHGDAVATGRSPLLSVSLASASVVFSVDAQMVSEWLAQQQRQLQHLQQAGGRQEIETLRLGFGGARSIASNRARTSTLRGGGGGRGGGGRFSSYSGSLGSGAGSRA